MSGITVDDGCVTEWNNMKLKHLYTYLSFKVQDEKSIVVDKKGKGSWNDFKACLDPSGCRYICVEVPGSSKIVFILWAPDSAKVKDKMIYASSRQALLDKLQGVTKALQASDLSGVEESHVKAQIH